MHSLYAAVSIRKTVVALIDKFHVLAITKTGRVITKSEAIKLAVEIATKELEK